MNIQEFQKLPIGTVLIWKSIKVCTIEVKISKNRSIIVNNYNSKYNDASGLNCSYDVFSADILDTFEIAPRWMQNLWRVK